MRKEPKFAWNDGHAICETIDNMGRVFKGEAWCDPLDKDFENELVGCTIAEMRAMIAAARTYRDDIKLKLSSLYHLKSCIEQSSHVNLQSYEYKMLNKQINLLESDLNIAKHQLAVLKLNLYEYLRDKEELYQAIRRNRKDDN